MAPKIIDKEWFVGRLNVLLASIIQERFEDIEKQILLAVEQMGYSTDILKVDMNIEVEGGKKYHIFVVGQSFDLAAILLSDPVTGKHYTPGEIDKEDFKAIVHAIEQAFSKIRDGSLAPGAEFKTHTISHEPTVPTPTKGTVH